MAKVYGAAIAALLSFAAPAMAETPYDMVQQVFTISLLSNVASGEFATADEITASFCSRATNFFNAATIRSLIGQWNIVWGPVVYKAPHATVASNSMFVVNKGNIYVVGVTATNPISAFDWKKEDAAVSETVAWTYGNKIAGTSPAISAGTFLGLTNLLALKSSPEKRDLQDFLKSVASPNNELYFTGHSLAGTLSPTLALALFNDGAALNRSDWKSVRVYPSGGATPGNQDFSSLYGTIFPKTPAIATPGTVAPYEMWNAEIWNSLDVVPHVWAVQKIAPTAATIADISGIYGDKLDRLARHKIKGKIKDAIHETNGNQYVMLPNVELSGTQQQNPLVTWPQFKKEMLYQHIDAYPLAIGNQIAATYIAYLRQNDKTKAMCLN